VNPYLFIFGYETPRQLINNKAHGWDDEDSTTIFIKANDEAEALFWGREIAKWFVAELYRKEGGPSGFDWLDAGYAHSIENQDAFNREDLEKVLTVNVGEYPAFDSLYVANHNTCPSCNSSEVIPIMYGKPSPENVDSVSKGKIKLGGGVLSDNSPNKYCKACHHSWLDKTDPAWVAGERMRHRLRNFRESKNNKS
jgi:hypothetical protein